MQKYVVLLVLFITTLHSASNNNPVKCYIFNGGTTYMQEQYNGMQLTATYHNKHKSYNSSECKLEASLNSFLEHDMSKHGKKDYMRLRELFLQQQKKVAPATQKQLN